MDRLLSVMLWLPIDVCVATMDVFVGTAKGLRDSSRTATRVLDADWYPAYVSFNSKDDATQSERSRFPYGFPSQLRTEGRNMYEFDNGNNDLSGDQIKYVGYSILFNKPDHQATLQSEQEVIVDYDTDSASFGALKIAEYTGQFGKDASVPIPAAWASNLPPDDGGKKGYQFHKNNTRFRNIPAKDRKYIRFVYEVKNRMERENANYEREQVEAIREVKQAINGIWD